MKTIKTILEQRDKLFTDTTKVALDRISPVLDGVREYLVSADPSYDPGIFTWEGIEVFEETIFLVGVVFYPPGESFDLNGETITITEDNKEYFNRVLQIGIPLSVVDQEDKNAVFTFLNDLHRVIKEDDSNTVTGKEPSGDFEFNLEDLSDEQLAALELSNKTGKMN